MNGVPFCCWATAEALAEPGIPGLNPGVKKFMLIKFQG